MILVLTLTASLFAYASEKGGNNVPRSQELKLILHYFEQTNLCRSPIHSHIEVKKGCRELEIEFINQTGNLIGEEFYRQCCDN